MMVSPYSKTEPWTMAATRHRGTIYLSEVETDEAREAETNRTPRMQQMCYWGLKFEDYLTNEGIHAPCAYSKLWGQSFMFWMRVLIVIYSTCIYVPPQLMLYDDVFRSEFCDWSKFIKCVPYVLYSEKSKPSVLGSPIETRPR